MKSKMVEAIGLDTEPVALVWAALRKALRRRGRSRRSEEAFHGLDLRS